MDFVRAGLEGFGRAKGGYLGRQVATLERVATKQVCRRLCVRSEQRVSLRLVGGQVYSLKPSGLSLLWSEN